MPIPLYFSAKCKESVTFPAGTALPYGCGMTQDGQLRLPEDFWARGPLLFNDAVPVFPTQQALRRLCELCEHGCILDFERPVQSFHIALIRALQEHGVKPLWLPERFYPYAKSPTVLIPSDVNNAWQRFCRAQMERYPVQWALELQPICFKQRLPWRTAEGGGALDEAVCRWEADADGIGYYDTQETLLKKLRIAEAFGCQGAVALWSEWPKNTA